MKQHWNQYWNSLENISISHWESEGPNCNLVKWYQSNLVPLKVLEIGCGTGTDSIWMAQQGSCVVATDVSDRVLNEARRRCADFKVEITFLNMDIVEDVVDQSFDLVYDRGCFHLYNQEADQIKFVKNIKKILNPGGTWLSLCASVESWDDTQPGKSGKTAGQLIKIIEPFMRVSSVKETWFKNPPGLGRYGWEIQSQLRTKPVAPWTEWLVDQ
jgi:ubiquinone/menaquinone biosynthesis C-methylase UbiE